MEQYFAAQGRNHFGHVIIIALGNATGQYDCVAVGDRRGKLRPQFVAVIAAAHLVD